MKSRMVFVSGKHDSDPAVQKAHGICAFLREGRAKCQERMTMNQRESLVFHVPPHDFMKVGPRQTGLLRGMRHVALIVV